MKSMFSTTIKRTHHLVELTYTYRKALLAATAGSLVIMGLGSAYQWHQARRVDQALTDFEELVQPTVFGRVGKQGASNVRKFETLEEKFQAATNACEQGYAQYKGTKVGALFPAYQSIAAIEQGEHDQARVLMEQAAQQIPEHTIAQFYQLSAIMLKFDSKDHSVAQQGLTELSKVAQSKDHAAHELALYLLGLHYWGNNDFNLAKQYWQELVLQYGTKEGPTNSGLADRVRSQLALISPAF